MCPGRTAEVRQVQAGCSGALHESGAWWDGWNQCRQRSGIPRALYAGDNLAGWPDLKQLSARMFQSTLYQGCFSKLSEAEVVWGLSVLECFMPVLPWCKGWNFKKH